MGFESMYNLLEINFYYIYCLSRFRGLKGIILKVLYYTRNLFNFKGHKKKIEFLNHLDLPK